MNRTPAPGKVVKGYSQCWYCDDIVVDARVFEIDTPLDGVLVVAVCRKRSCRDAARDRKMHRD